METRAKIMMAVTIFTAFVLTPIVFDLVLASPIPDTGQTKCYDNTQEMTTCPSPGEDFYGQDAKYTINQQSYTEQNGNSNHLHDKA